MRNFDLEVVMLVETQISGFKVKNVIKRIELPNSYRVEARGFSGGICVLWKSTTEVKVMTSDF